MDCDNCSNYLKEVGVCKYCHFEPIIDSKEDILKMVLSLLYDDYNILYYHTGVKGDDLEINISMRKIK